METEVMPPDNQKLVCEQGYKLEGERCVQTYVDHSADPAVHPVDMCTETLMVGPNTVTCSHPAKPEADE